MLLTIAIIGGLLLVGLAVSIGWVDGSSQENAWKRIALERRRLWELRQELLAFERELNERAARGECPRCRATPPQDWAPPAA